MAIAPTGAIYKSLSFDGKNSRDYGVYITGEAVYNAPERDVELVTIPGRNGSFALDNGRFENIEVTYPAGIFAYTEEDFRKAISDFRNLLCSRKGYVRLSDEYNPDEYRMAVYKSGLDVSPAQLKAGEFDITFDCKPQRFLVSGEEAVEIGVWGDTETEIGSIVTIEADDTTAIKDLTADITPMQSGSGDPSPSNVRPISGHTDVVVSRAGKNLFDIGSWLTANSVSYTMVNDFYKFTVTAGLYSNFFALPSGEKTLSATLDTNNTTATNVRFRVKYSDGTTDNNVTIAALPITGDIVGLALNWSGSGTIAIKPQIELGSTDTTYEAYQGDTYTTALGTTVYGGTLDVTTETLTVTHIRMDLGSPVSGSWNYATDNTYNVFYLNKEQLPALPRYTGGVITSLSDSFNAIANTTFPIFANGANNNNCLTITSEGTVQRILIRCDLYTSAASFQTAMSGHYVVYELATPTTVQLTAEEIDLLLGQKNNIWASSGDVTVEYGQDPNKLPNPTLFESKPLLEVAGYGEITLGDATIKIENVDMGEVVAHEPYTPSTPNPAHIWLTLETSLLNIGDAITVPSFQITNNMKVVSTWSQASMKTVDVLSTDKVASYSTGITGQHTSYVKFTPNDFVFNYGTSATSETASIEVHFEARTSGGAGVTPTITFTYYAVYDGANRIDFYFSGNNAYIVLDSRVLVIPKITGDSSISALPTVMYIDLDIGEAYGDFSGVIASLNNAVQLPAQLPTLAVGHTDITFDNTITSLKIRPRWFKI